MPHIDWRTGEIVIRIVYDGAPESGKTTNVQQLGNMVSLMRRGAAMSPGTHGARTEFFDWLDFSGGFIDGRRVRCQLVSVPGQSELLHRRRYLLESADALVFVVDACAELDAAAVSLALARKISESVETAASARAPVALIVQANKQDLPGALSPAQLGVALDLPATCSLMGSAAASGQGVMETFVLAVRLATERARELVLSEQLAEAAPCEDDPEALHRALLVQDREAAAAREAERLEDALKEATRVVAQRAERTRSERGENPRTKTLAPARTLAAWDPQLLLPLAVELAAGHVWPPLQGRATLSAATSSRLQRSEHNVTWAPPDAEEWRSEQGFTLHTSERWLYPSEASARHGLMAQVHALLPHLALVPEGRALVVSPEDSRYRLWLITPPVLSVAASLHAALAEPSDEALRACLQLILALSRALDSHGILGVKLPAGSSGIAFSEGRLQRLGLWGKGDAPAASEPIAELSELLRRASAASPAARAWFEHEARPALEALGERCVNAQRGEYQAG